MDEEFQTKIRLVFRNEIARDEFITSNDRIMTTR
jgi:hypothetical protein